MSSKSWKAEKLEIREDGFTAGGAEAAEKSRLLNREGAMSAKWARKCPQVALMTGIQNARIGAFSILICAITEICGQHSFLASAIFALSAVNPAFFFSYFQLSSFLSFQFFFTLTLLLALGGRRGVFGTGSCPRPVAPPDSRGDPPPSPGPGRFLFEVACRPDAKNTTGFKGRAARASRSTLTQRILMAPPITGVSCQQPHPQNGFRVGVLSLGGWPGLCARIGF